MGESSNFFGFHLAQFMPVALFPLRWVDQLGFSDMEIAIGTAAFHASVLVSSLPVGSIDAAARQSLYHSRGRGAVEHLSPLHRLYAEPDLLRAYIGRRWAGLGILVGGAPPNYMLEKVPPNDRPRHLCRYNLALNAASLTLWRALLGPLLAGWFNLQIALVLAFGFRFANAIFIWFVERTKPAASVTAT